ncbi:MAG: hypothetical protein JWP96_131 [Polaromonas sp.]|nr:hypothetical protein [Polaromonas sp.]
MSPLPYICEPSMTNENVSVNESLEDFPEEEIGSTGDHHRMAAHHFSAAAKHHLAAAAADDEGDDEANARHAHMAYRHQLNGVQYAEIAVMDNDNLEDEFDNGVEASI